MSSRSDDALHAVTCAVEAAPHFDVEPEPIRSSVRLLCVLARQEDLPVERVLIRLRAMFGRSASLRQMPVDIRDQAERDAIRYLITAYYSDRQ